MSTVSTMNEIINLITQTVKEFPVMGLRGKPEEGRCSTGGACFNWRRCFGVEAGLSVHFVPSLRTNKVIVQISVNQPAGNKSVGSMLAQISLTEEVCRLAALIETRIEAYGLEFGPIELE